MTLFSRATTSTDVFSEALVRYFGGEPDAGTLAHLA